METKIKTLPATVRPKGTGLPGLTATLHKRTARVAWYIRSDGYHEVFIIKTGLSFDKSEMMEYYPANEDIGRTGICTGSVDKAARYFADLCLGKHENERMAPERNKDTTHSHKCKIQRSLH
jgi:hypothetical protein